MTCHLINKHMDLCAYYSANLSVIQLKDRLLAGTVKQNNGNLYISIPLIKMFISSKLFV